MNEHETRAEDEPKGVDLVQREEDMENSRMDRSLSTVREFIADQKAGRAPAAVSIAPPPSQDRE